VGKLKDFRARKQAKLRAKAQKLKDFSNRNDGVTAKGASFVSVLESVRPNFGGGSPAPLPLPPAPVTPPVFQSFIEINIPGVGVVRVPSELPAPLVQGPKTVPKQTVAPIAFAPGTAAARPDLPNLVGAASGPLAKSNAFALVGGQVFSLAGGGAGGGFPVQGTQSTSVTPPGTFGGGPQLLVSTNGEKPMGLTSSLTGIVGGVSDLVTAILPLAEVGVGIAGAVTGGSSGGPGTTTTGLTPSTLQQSAATQAGLGGDLQALVKEFAIGTPASPWKLTCGGRSMGPQMHIQVNPLTQALTWFRPAGKPILWSSDLTAAKRVRKIAARAHRKR